MTQNAFEQLKDLVSGESLLNEGLFASVDFDTLLDSRDEDVFSSKWMKTYKELEREKERVKLRKKDVDAVTQLREVAFKKVWSLTDGSELASYVSDDFGLLADALKTGYENEWLNALWDSYRRGEVPTGELEPVPGRLAEIIGN